VHNTAFLELAMVLLVGQKAPVLDNPHHVSKSNLHLLGPHGRRKHQVFASAENRRFEATHGVQESVDLEIISNSHTQDEDGIIPITPLRSHLTHLNTWPRGQSRNSLSITVSSFNFSSIASFPKNCTSSLCE
jgi:hypothetical protein